MPTSSRRKKVWIVESLWQDVPNSTWGPTVGIGLDREDGRAVLKDWQERNPDDKFRLVQYKRG